MSTTNMPNVAGLSLDPKSATGTATSDTTRSTSKASAASAPIGPTSIPFDHSPPDCKPVARAALTADQFAKYTQLFEQVSKWSGLPVSTSDKTIQVLSDNEKMWLTRECLLRYLRATTWNVANADKRLQDTMIWRREYGVETWTAEHISPENETGKQVILGYDNNARPCLYLNPGKQNTKKSERQIQHLVYMLERVIDMMDPGQETTALLINFKGSSSGGSPSVAQGRQVMTILQGHYPERLGRACIADLPWFINAFFKLISPFIDPVTREKMIFNDDLRKHVPPTQLQKDYGGDVDFQYDHSAYWPALNKICAERRAVYKDRWIKGGKQIGEYEAYLQGGDQQSLSSLSNGVVDAKDVSPVDTAEIGATPRAVGE